MPSPALVAVVALLCAYAALGPLRRSFAVVVLATVLLPGTLILPGVPTELPNAVRLIHLAFLFGLVLRIRSGRLDRAVLRPSTSVIALTAWAIGLFVLGVAAEPWGAGTDQAFGEWLKVPDQLLMLVIALAAARAIGDSRWVLRVLGAAAAAMALIATYEHLTGQSFSQWVFQGAPAQLASVAANPLEVRGGMLRVRAAATFALEYGWLAVMLLPALVVVAARSRSPLVAASPALVAATVVWSVSRSPVVAVAVAVALLGALQWRSPRTVGLVLAGAALVAAAVAVRPTLVAPFFGPEAHGSVEVRAQRTPVLLDFVAESPWTGLGIQGLRAAEVGVLDSSFLVSYGEGGVVGLTFLVLVLTAAVLDVARGRRGLRPSDRPAADAALVAVVAGIAGAMIFSLFQQPGSSRVFWLVVGVGTAVAEQGRRRRSAPSPRWAGVAALGGLAVGSLIFALAPRPAAVYANFSAVPPAELARGISDQVHFGNIQANTTCELLEALGRAEGARVRCTNPRQAPGVGAVRFEADDLAQVRRAAANALAAAQGHVRGLQVAMVGPASAARPTWARTAPLWAALLPAGAMVLLWVESRAGTPVGLSAAVQGANRPSGPSGARRARRAPTSAPTSRASSVIAPVRSPDTTSRATRAAP